MPHEISFLRQASTIFIRSRNFSTKPGFNKLVTLPVSQPSERKGYGTDRFFEATREHKKIVSTSFIPLFLSEEVTLRKILSDIDPHTEGNYLMEHFLHWLSKYAAQSTLPLRDYFSHGSDLNLAPVCKDFIDFCFKDKIFLDPDETLKSFNYHNQLSDLAVKEQLRTIKPKNQINILGFGLDEGHYEKTLANFLVDNGLAKIVNIYGFDPYAAKTPGIEYLTSLEMASKKELCFDLITARWVLHHVELEHRWANFVKCVNSCQPGAMVLIVEHGFLKKQPPRLDKKIYYLLNAIFDVVANIGLRPRYFAKNTPDVDSNFFIKYLEPEDFNAIKDSVSVHAIQSTYDIGPDFPNQTIFCMRIT